MAPTLTMAAARRAGTVASGRSGMGMIARGKLKASLSVKPPSSFRFLEPRFKPGAGGTTPWIAALMWLSFSKMALADRVPHACG
jgi:hypothetical protein